MKGFSFQDPTFIGAVAGGSIPAGGATHQYNFIGSGDTDDETDQVGSNDLEVIAGSWPSTSGVSDNARFSNATDCRFTTKTASSEFTLDLYEHFSLVISAKFDNSTLTTGNSAKFLSLGDLSGATAAWCYLYLIRDAVTTDHYLGFVAPDGNNGQHSTAISFAAWHTITFVWNATAGKFYLNWNSTTEESNHGTSTQFTGAGTTSKLQVGDASLDVQTWVDTLTIYNSALI